MINGTLPDAATGWTRRHVSACFDRSTCLDRTENTRALQSAVHVSQVRQEGRADDRLCRSMVWKAKCRVHITSPKKAVALKSALRAVSHCLSVSVKSRFNQLKAPRRDG